ncbi:hypothetical protein SDC9_125696 [bioreactor metagenome]|uniref:Uncharacterized protein n=1 Tax=bioreactor metagenome TaxID=1076179 RepID=A0A645CP65_9ZZZZ
MAMVNNTHKKMTNENQFGNKIIGNITSKGNKGNKKGEVKLFSSDFKNK